MGRDLRESMKLFVGIVTDAFPDDAPPGSIKIKIPELFEDEELPHLVPPMVSAHSSWESVPLTETQDGEEARIIVVRLAPETFRWIGTDQMWSWVLDGKGSRCGVRSPDGKRTIKVDDDAGIEIKIDGNATINLGNDKTVVINSSGDGNSSKITLSNGSLKLESGNGSVLEMGATPTFHTGAAAAATQVVVEGQLGFGGKLGASLLELMALPAAFGMPVTNASLTGGTALAGGFKGKLKTD